MTQHDAVRVLAGALILLGLGLGFWVSPWWFGLSAFVGLNLFQSGFTGICPAERIFGWLGLSDRPCQVTPANAKPRT